MEWKPFRQRYQQAIEDLGILGDEEGMSLRTNMLGQVGKDVWERNGYKLRRWLTQKCAGLQERLVGHRMEAAFRVGKLTSGQQQWIAESGYELVETS